MICEQCSGPTYDNRQKVADGWKGPLFKCKDKECGWVKWPPREPKRAAQAQAGHAAAKWTWPKLSGTYGKCVAIAEKHLIAAGARTKVTYTAADLLASAATLFIAASRDGVAETPRPVVQAEPTPERPEPEADEWEDE